MQDAFSLRCDVTRRCESARRGKLFGNCRMQVERRGWSGCGGTMPWSEPGKSVAGAAGGPLPASSGLVEKIRCRCGSCWKAAPPARRLSTPAANFEPDHQPPSPTPIALSLHPSKPPSTHTHYNHNGTCISLYLEAPHGLCRLPDEAVAVEKKHALGMRSSDSPRLLARRGDGRALRGERCAALAGSLAECGSERLRNEQTG